jgi:hypothetical protein
VSALQHTHNDISITSKSHHSVEHCSARERHCIEVVVSHTDGEGVAMKEDGWGWGWGWGRDRDRDRDRVVKQKGWQPANRLCTTGRRVRVTNPYAHHCFTGLFLWIILVDS